jgi:hypothetical protein
LPAEEYDWFDLHEPGAGRPRNSAREQGDPLTGLEAQEEQLHESAPAPQKDFFEFPGPLFNVRISPASSVMRVGGTKNLRAVPRDRANRQVEKDLVFRWEIVQGDGSLKTSEGEMTTFLAGAEPGLATIRVTVKQMEIECSADALITITDSLLPEGQLKEGTKQGIPSYTFQKAPGELWRSRYDSEKNVVVINNGHRDFVFASRNKVLKVRYICRLFAKELVAKNFAGLPPGELLERLIELTLYSEENLK